MIVGRLFYLRPASSRFSAPPTPHLLLTLLLLRHFLPASPGQPRCQRVRRAAALTSVQQQPTRHAQRRHSATRGNPDQGVKDLSRCQLPPGAGICPQYCELGAAVLKYCKLGTAGLKYCELGAASLTYCELGAAGKAPVMELGIGQAS